MTPNRKNSAFGHPTFSQFLRQRVCSHSKGTGRRGAEIGQIVCCDLCGYTVWTKPPPVEAPQDDECDYVLLDPIDFDAEIAERAHTHVPHVDPED